jgi:hypothetical protein
MKVESSNQFTPVNIHITLETKEEFKNFKEMVRFCDSISAMLQEKDSFADRRMIYKMLKQIYNSIDE